MATKKDNQNENMGRPTIFTPEIATEICRKIATEPVPHNSMRAICRDNKHLPHRNTILNWILKATKEDAPQELKYFLCQYREAEQIRELNYFDEILDVAYDDNGDLLQGKDGLHGNSTNVARDRLKADNLKWVLGRLNPNRYGDRTSIDNTHEFKGGIIEQTAREIKEAYLKRLEGK